MKKVKRNAPDLRPPTKKEQIQIASNFAKIGKENGILIHSCCEKTFLSEYGLKCNGCMSQEIIEKSIPKSKQNDGHPAKRTFQAIRIEVNNEIKPLEDTIKNSIDVLKSKGRLCVITFHSLEDRAVKQAMNRAKGMCTCPKDIPYCVCGAKELGTVITRKPIIASEEEQRENSRSKSAKLRIFEKI